MPQRVITHKHLLKALHALKPKYRKALLQVCEDQEINIICECIYNILKGKIPLKENERDVLAKYKNVLRKLVAKSNTKLRKNVIIQKGGAFLPIVLGAVLNALVNNLML